MFYDFKNHTDSSDDLYIYGDIVTDNKPDWDGNIDENAVDLKLFKEKVNTLGSGQTLNIYINSGGGSVFAAAAMISMLKRAKERGAKIVSYVDGLAASSASLFPMVADEAHIYNNSMLMIHKPMSAIFFAVMSSADLRKEADALDAVENGVLMPAYKSRSKITEQKLKNMVAAETWLNAEEITEIFDGFILHDEEKQAAACTSQYFDKYFHTPEAFRKAEPVKTTVDLSEYKNKLISLKERM